MNWSFFALGNVPTYGRHNKGRSFKKTDEQPNTRDDKVKVKVYAEGEGNIAKAMRQLKKAMFDEWIVDNINDPLVLTMPNHKVTKLNSFLQNHAY